MKNTEINNKTRVFDCLFDSLFDSVIVTDETGVIVDWNKAAENLFGYEKRDTLGQAINLIHVKEDSENLTLSVISSLSKNGKWSKNIRYLHKNGSVGWVEAKCVAIFNDDKEMIGTIGVYRHFDK